MDFTIYHAHPITGEYIGAGQADIDPLDHDNLLIPAHAYSDAPPEADAGFAVIRNGDKWELVKDLRGPVYSTASGAEFEYAELGELPEGYTHLPCPGPDYAWTGTDWALDEALQHERLSLAEREWRNVQVEGLKWLRERHRDEQDLQRETTLSGEQFGELLDYLQALRDWPQSEQFPVLEHRPITPTWIADQTQ